ncbi:MAG: tRNA preQ1(34) S-adenosylmethionine ribosyltransferase-isomerase QueA [Nanoarchaeota archaeon]|nr:tRNA preQ1(34) S-adenosylmethionine ribosyltransferase-isomerase QueA [Nanoarchaeota archaeon]
MKLSIFDYPLPRNLIAHSPSQKRDHSRLMVVGEEIEHKTFSDIIDYLEKDDVLVVNEARVMSARIDGKKSTGGPIQVILLPDATEKTSEGWDCWCKIKGRNPRVGTHLIFNKELSGYVIEQTEDSFLVTFRKDPFVAARKIGKLPIPWYIKKQLESEERYQTVYSHEKKAKSLAAPTAGLHFTSGLLKRLEKKGVRIAKICLHISFDTFLPIKTENIFDHKMHSEEFEIDSKSAKLINSCKGRLFCVGTTSLRALESSCGKDCKVVAGKTSTRIYIHPQYRFRSKVYGLITNFHLPKSSLFVLVCGFAGTKKIHAAYKTAIDMKYRFYSFGDAMLLFRS